MRYVKNLMVALLLMLSLQGLLCGQVHAHHLWVISKGHELVVARGIAPDDLQSYDSAKVSELKAFAADGSAIPTQRFDEPEQVRFVAERTPAFATVTCAWGERVNTLEGKKLISRRQAEEQGLKVLSSFQSFQYSAVYFDSTVMCGNRLGSKLEIMALSDPSALRNGHKMPVQVFFEGRPLAGCKVGTGRKKSEIFTDRDGKAELEIGMDSMQVLTCIHKVSVDKGVDYQQFMAFLIFMRP